MGAAVFLTGFAGAGRTGLFAAGFGAGFFAATFLAGLTDLRDTAFAAGLCAGFFATAFFAGLADFFATGFFAAGLRLEFAMFLTNIVPQRSRVIA